MKRLFVIVSFFLASLLSYADINYGFYLDVVKSEIKAQKSRISNLEKMLKTDKNNVQLHKDLVYANTTLKELEAKQETVKEAEKQYKKLVKANKDLDEMKIKLLDIKRESESADTEMLKLFK